MFNNIKDIKDLDKYLINDDFTYRHYAIGSPNNNDIFPYSKIIWGCGICEHDKKVQMNYVFPLMIYNNSNEGCYVLFSINTSFNDKYHYVETAKEMFDIAWSHIRDSSGLSIYSELQFLNINEVTDLTNFDIKLFDSPGDAEYYRKETEKILRKKIKADKESDSANMISLEDIANKFNIDIDKLIIKGIWNDPYNKKRTKV